MERLERWLLSWRKSNCEPEVYRDEKGWPFLCPVRRKSDPAMIAFARQVHLRWWDPLARLAEDLDGLEGSGVEGSAPQLWRPGAVVYGVASLDWDGGR